MKTMSSLVTLSLIIVSAASAAQAEVPRQLLDLLPPGKSNVQVQGTTPDNQVCSVQIGGDRNSFSASVAVLDAGGRMNSRRFATFQLGFGHKLQNLRGTKTSLVAVSTHEAEESYSSDSRDTLKIKGAPGQVNSVQIVNEDSGLFGYKTERDETCNLK